MDVKPKAKAYCEQTRTSDGTMITMEEFGRMPDESIVYKVTVTNRSRSSMELISYGAALKSLTTADRHSRPVNLVLGYDTLEEYLHSSQPVGAVLGRIAGRVTNGQIFMGAKKPTQLAKNDGEHHTNGGQHGFHTQNFEVTIRGSRVFFTHHSPARDDGYPGSLRCNVSYQLNNWNELIVDYEASSDEPTPVNLTSFIGFNLSGDHAAHLGEHQLQLFCDYHVPMDPHGSHTGDIAWAHESVLNLTDLASYYERVKTAKMEGIDIGDVYWCHRVKNKSKFDRHTIVSLTFPSTGLKLEVETSHPGLQLVELDTCKSHLNEAGRQAGLVFFTSGFPDATKHPQFPTIVLPRGEVYYQVNVYKLSLEEEPVDT